MAPSYWEKVCESQVKVSIHLTDNIDFRMCGHSKEALFWRHRNVPPLTNPNSVNGCCCTPGAVVAKNRVSELAIPGQFAHVLGFAQVWGAFVKELEKVAETKESQESCLSLCCDGRGVETSFAKINKAIVSQWKAEFEKYGIAMADYDFSDFYAFNTSTKAGIQHFVVNGIELVGTSTPPLMAPVSMAPQSQSMNQQQGQPAYGTQQRSFPATMPPGVQPGQPLTVATPEGTHVTVMCPEGVQPGGVFLVPY
ncbi:hypothetical protein CYMTET_21615 [Cymbomonas tetramitiformis]|uniref:Uncharacterized protein n=1 Tax=Cymbomonas tetramitiformis TaxID=36881 RepID=A0AAE0G266_9CHLO|nr:hypothetical protein CYMTET_21615 [Cymbomonas tetramitiformis]